MKKNNKPLTDFEKLQGLFEAKFAFFEKQMQDVLHNQKISNEKNAEDFNNLRFEIMTEAARIRQEIDSTTRAEIQVAKNELQDVLKELEERLSKRLTHVADLITIQLGGKIQNHEKRIKKLERAIQTA